MIKHIGRAILQALEEVLIKMIAAGAPDKDIAKIKEIIASIKGENAS